MIHIGLTGNIASGKSTVASLLARWGATVIDADQLTRDLQVPGSPVFDRIIATFGPGVRAADGSLDRGRLRALVLADPARRGELEQIVHPAVAARRAELLAAAARAGARVVVSDIPLLFEALDPAEFDAVLLVDAPDDVRLARLLAHRGMREPEARALMATQRPSAAKRAWRGPQGQRALVIQNDAGLEELERRTRAAWEVVLQRAESP